MSRNYVLKTIRIEKIVRSRRRSIAAEFNEDASLTIRAPYWVTMHYIERFIEERKNWLLRNHQIALERYRTLPKRRYEEGENFLYLGKEHALTIGHYPHRRLDLAEGTFRLSQLYANNAKKVFLSWYRERAAKHLPERVAKYSALMGIAPKGIRISSAFRQWGSCSPQNVLCFPWRIMMAPQDVIDSIVVHEIAHLKDRTHSKRFWHQVKSVFPHYDDSDRWLSANAHRMIL